MTVYIRIIIALGLFALTPGASADPLLRADDGISLPIIVVDPAAPRVPLGIEGNGLLGIEGNGIIQRRFGNDLVLNDSLYSLGPGKVRVLIDATAAALGDIQAGHVVLAGARPSGQGQAPVLAQIELDHLVRGPIEVGGVNATAGTIRVLGQLLVIPDFAELAEGLDGLDIEDLGAGDYLRVSGWLDDDGAVVSTRIERTAPLPDVLELSGRVDALDGPAMTLMVGDLEIDYSTAEFVYMTAGELAVNDRLEVVGNLLTPGGQLVATRIRRAPLPLSGVDGQVVEVQGYANGPIVAGEFTLTGQVIRVSASTVYERGDELDVVAGSLLEVEGEIDTDGTLRADRIEFDAEVVESEIRVSGTVQTVDQGLEQLQIFGLTVSANVATRYEDKTDSTSPFEAFSDVEPGIFLDLRGYDDPDGSNSVTTSRMTREMPGNSFVQARVSANDGVTIELLGLAVATDAGTSYHDEQGMPLSASEFLALAQVGVLIKVTGTPIAGGIDATELELE